MTSSTTKGQTMNYVWEVDTEQQCEGVARTLICIGEMVRLEIQEQDNGTVVGTAWRVIPATFWEPEDYDCIHEMEYESTGQAKLMLEMYDSDIAEEQARMEKYIDESYQEWKKLEQENVQ